ncbi:MAG: cache domain-containing protein [Lachnospiraceae bacterium]|nr:cache domain-containing protein [Candidatus Colinaster equi]
MEENNNEVLSLNGTQMGVIEAPAQKEDKAEKEKRIKKDKAERLGALKAKRAAHEKSLKNEAGNTQTDYSLSAVVNPVIQNNGKKGKIKKKFNFGITLKLISVCAIPMLVVSIIIVTLSVRTLTNSIESEIEKSLNIVATSVSETYTNLYKGDYTQDKGGKVRKGDTVISKNTKLIDALYEKTGFQVSMMYGNMRLITTLKKDNGAGRRINGTSIEEEYYQAIQNGEPHFVKGYVISDVDYYVMYTPLINSDGSVIGAIEVATPSASVKKTTKSQTLMILVVSAIFMIIAVAFALLISNRMGKAMKKIKEFLKQVKDGKLDNVPHSKTMKRKDELGDIYRTSVDLQKSLFDIVNNIIQAAGDLTASAEALSNMAQNTQGTVGDVVHATEQIAERASSQAVDAKVTSDGVMGMNEDIKQIKSDMKVLVGYAESMADAEQKSQDIVEELNTQSLNTRKSLDSVSNQIDIMNKSVQGIEKAITLITDIADETDLLSLNASIEAARAGEAGRGFSVVAEQIKKLADQSSGSAGEINKIIKDVMQISSETVNIMNDVYHDMDMQQQKLEETMAQSRHVSESVDKSLEGINNISGKVDSLRESSHDIKESVTTLAGISEKTASTAEQTIDTVDSMSDTMNTLMTSAERLTILADKLNASLGIFHI